MHILIVIAAVGSVYGGPSKIVLELAQSLGALGINVDIVTTNANGADRLAVPLQTWIIEKFYRIQYFPCWIWGDYKFSLSLTNWLKREVVNYDLVHTGAIFSLPNLPAYWACQQHQIPYIVAPHGMLEPWAMSYRAWKKQLYYRLFERSALQQASVIQITSSPEARGIQALGIHTPLVLIPNGIHRQEFELMPSPETFYQIFPETRHRALILFLGRIDPKKGLDLLALAFAQVVSQFPQAHLVVAGPDNVGFLPTVQEYFAQAKCSESVTFTGMVTGAVKLAALAAATVYVAPSYSEGFSMSVLEGMAAGLPCVITTGCNFPEAAAAGVVYGVNSEPESIAHALIRCLANPSEAKVFGDRARQFIFEYYTWETIAQNLIQVYQTVLESPHLAANEIPCSHLRLRLPKR